MALPCSMAKSILAWSNFMEKPLHRGTWCSQMARILGTKCGVTRSAAQDTPGLATQAVGCKPRAPRLAAQYTSIFALGRPASKVTKNLRMAWALLGNSCCVDQPCPYCQGKIDPKGIFNSSGNFVHVGML